MMGDNISNVWVALEKHYKINTSDVQNLLLIQPLTPPSTPR
jgi:hypothetical protein